MISPAEIDALRARTDLRSVAEAMGARFRGRAKWGACPICGGGPAAARFEIKGEKWVCAVCQDGGDVIRLVERVRGLSFLDAVAELGGTPKLSAAQEKVLAEKRAAAKAKTDAETQRWRERVRKQLYELWTASPSILGSVAEVYLRARGITWRLEELELRFAANLPYLDGSADDERGQKVAREIFRGPAMLAAFVGADGRFLALHRTWIDAERPGKKATIVDPETGAVLPAKKMRGHKQGGFVKLLKGPVSTKIVAGEGIETTLSVREVLRDAAEYRAAGDLGNLCGPAAETVAHPTLKTKGGRPGRVGGAEPDFSRQAMPVPDMCVDLTLLRDGDSDPFLTDLAMIRGGRRFSRDGRVVRCADAPPGVDFNDLLVAE